MRRIRWPWPSFAAWSIRSRLLLLVLLGVLPSAGLMAHLAWQYRSERIEAASAQALSVARLVAGDHEEVVEGARQLLRALARIQWLWRDAPDTCRDTLADLARDNPRYNSILSIDADGVPICGSEPVPAHTTYAGQDFFVRALETGKFVTGDMSISRVNQVAVLPFARPFRDTAGMIRGVVLASLRLDWLGKGIEQLELPASAILTVTDREGTVLAARPKEAAIVGDPAPWVVGLADGVQGARLFEHNGQLVGLAAVKENELFVAVAVPRNAVTAAGDRRFTHHLLVILGIASVNLGLAWLVGELSIGRRVRAFTAVAHRLRRGDLSARPMLPPGGGELQVLQETFDRMAAELERRDAALRRSAEDFRQQALHDELTGLPSRTLFLDRLEQSMAQARRDGLSAAVLALDLDHFKDVNDLLGHAAGDQLLIEVAQRLRRCVRDCDTIGRLGGDEFAVIVGQIGRREQAVEVAVRIDNQLERPFRLRGQRWHLSTSIGITVFPSDATDASDLLRCADLALYQAKSGGRRTYSFYAPDMKARIEERKSVENQIRHALEHNELVLHYQPQIDLRTGAVIGVEALIRWQHPRTGLTAPDVFLPIAEESGLIAAIGQWTLRTACAEVAGWSALGLPPLRVAINVSAAQLWQPGLACDVAEALGLTGLDPSRLVLEIAEGVVLQRPTGDLVSTLKRLYRMGVGLAWDEFGTGYSSLTHLRNLPMREIKIDRSLVNSLGKGKQNAAIVKSMIGLAHALQLKVIAEGIETAEQARLLTDFGCDVGQGHYFGRPQPAAEIAFVREQRMARRVRTTSSFGTIAYRLH